MKKIHIEKNKSPEPDITRKWKLEVDGKMLQFESKNDLITRVSFIQDAFLQAELILMWNVQSVIRYLFDEFSIITIQEQIGGAWKDITREAHEEADSCIDNPKIG